MDAPHTGHKTIPVQQSPSRVTVETMPHGDARVTGVFDVVLPGTAWKARPAYAELETEIEQAIRDVLQKHAATSASQK